MADIGHNQPSFDAIVQENLARGLLLTIKDAYTTLSRDPRAEKRHFRVLAEIIDCLNFNEIDAKGMAWPGRKYLAQQSSDAMRPDGYSEATIAKTIADLIAWGYLAQDRRGPPNGGRAMSYYTVRKPSIEDLKAEIDAWVRAQRQGATSRPFPDKREQAAPANGERPLSVRSPDGERPLSVNNGERPLSLRADGEHVIPADGEHVIPTVTSKRGTSREEDRGSTVSKPVAVGPAKGLGPSLKGKGTLPAAPPAAVPDFPEVSEVELAVSAYNEMAERHGWTRCNALTPQRRKRVAERLKDIGGLERFRLGLSAIPRDRFLMGRTAPPPGKEPFKLSVDRLLQTEGGMGDVLAKLLDAAADQASPVTSADTKVKRELQEQFAKVRAEEEASSCR